MNVRVRFYAQLRDLIGKNELDLDLPSGSTTAQLLERLYVEMPALKLHDKSLLLGAGVEFVDRNHVIQSGEELAIMPPVQGG